MGSEGTVSIDVSVVVLIRNAEDTLERCLRSLFSQLCPSLEYVFVNDASTDRSMKILSEVVADYPQRRNHIVIIDLHENVGQARGRQIGVNASVGRYIIHCDSDDYVEPQMYKDLLEKARKEGCDIVRCLNQKEYEGGSVITGTVFGDDVYADKRKLMSNLLLNRGLSSLCNKLVKRELYEQVLFPESDTYEDFAIVLQLFYYAKKIGRIDKVYYHYVQRSGSTMHPISVELRMKQAVGMEQNISFMCDFLRSKGLEMAFVDEIVTLKLCAKYNWWNVNAENYKENWRRCFPEVMGMLGKNKYLKAMDIFRARLFDSGLMTPFACSLIKKLNGKN